MARIIPTSGTDADRLNFVSLGLFKPDEFTQTRTEKRAFVDSGAEIVAPVYHGEIDTEADMLALNDPDVGSVRGCHRSDYCLRTDIGCLAICISNRGEAVGDWTFVSLAGVVEGAIHWENITNGDPDSPEIYFDINGDVVGTFST